MNWGFPLLLSQCLILESNSQTDGLSPPYLTLYIHVYSRYIEYITTYITQIYKDEISRCENGCCPRVWTAVYSCVKG